MAYKTDPREEKLPRWAQDLLQDARSDANQYRRRLGETRTAENSDVMLDPVSDEPRGLGGNHTRIRFLDQVDVLTRDGTVEIIAVEGALRIEPKTSNVVRVFSADWNS